MSKLLTNTNDLQEVLETLQTKAAGGGEQAMPVISVNTSGLITATAGTKTSTHQLTTQAAKTITPTTSSQTAVNSGVYTTGAVTVGAIPSTYVKPTTTKSTTTYTPTTSNQTIAAGTYCSGVQTIKGDANLKAENIAEGVSIFGITGTHSGGGSGGGNIETCTVVINHPYTSLDYIPAHMATTYYNGEYSYDGSNYMYNGIYTPQYTINSVICGTCIYIESKIDSQIRGYSFENAELVDYAIGRFFIKITARAGETAVINIWDDD